MLVIAFEGGGDGLEPCSRPQTWGWGGGGGIQVLLLCLALDLGVEGKAEAGLGVGDYVTIGLEEILGAGVGVWGFRDTNTVYIVVMCCSLPWNEKMRLIER